MNALQVNEQPGSYLWHDHSASNRADGLQGALIVLPPNTDIDQFYKTDRVMFLTDWFHGKFVLAAIVCIWLQPSAFLCNSLSNCVQLVCIQTPTTNPKTEDVPCLLQRSIP